MRVGKATAGSAVATILVAALAARLWVHSRSGGDELRDVPPPPATPLFMAQMMTMTGLNYLADKTTPTPMKVMRDILGYTTPQMLYAACKLNIPDHLGNSGLTEAQLAGITGAPTERIHRLLTALESLGHFQMGSHDKWFNTASTSLLRSDAPSSLRPFLMHEIEDGYIAWSHFHEAVRDPTFIPFQATHNGVGWYDYLAQNSTQRVQFSKAMTSLDALGGEAIVRDFPFGNYRRVLDIGGSTGSLLTRILRQYPNIQGVLFELPAVIDSARQQWASAAQSRVQLVAGDLFVPSTVPRGMDGDVFLLRCILQDFDDFHAAMILKSVRSAIGSADARVVIVEPTIEGTGRDNIPARHVVDLHMAVMFSSKVRNEHELQDLLQATGFRREAVVYTRSFFTCTVAKPV